MSKYENESCLCNKYHTDTGYSIRSHSALSWKLTNKSGATLFVPKGQAGRQELKEGNCILTINGWWLAQTNERTERKNSEFFIT